jgi:hypothetical protein
MWDEIQERLRELGIEHHNKGIEAGMHLEILMAEFLAGQRVPTPENWYGSYDP